MSVVCRCVGWVRQREGERLAVQGKRTLELAAGDRRWTEHRENPIGQGTFVFVDALNFLVTSRFDRRQCYTSGGVQVRWALSGTAGCIHYNHVQKKERYRVVAIFMFLSQTKP